MARRVRLLAIASTGSEPKITVTENWAGIEKAYGRTLADNVRQRILEATTSFAYFEVFERTAEPVRDAIAVVSAIQSAAGALFEALTSSDSDAAFDALGRIRAEFKDHPFPDGANSLDALCGVLASLNGACRLTRNAMESPDAPEHREGECWENWMRSLTKIARENGLPFRVSKGSDKSDRTSPFVLLIRALHECVPKEARRHYQSCAALADAITVARRKNGGNKAGNKLRKSPA